MSKSRNKKLYTPKQIIMQAILFVSRTLQKVMQFNNSNTHLSDEKTTTTTIAHRASCRFSCRIRIRPYTKMAPVFSRTPAKESITLHMGPIKSSAWQKNVTEHSTWFLPDLTVVKNRYLSKEVIIISKKISYMWRRICISNTNERQGSVNIAHSLHWLALCKLRKESKRSKLCNNK